MGAAEAVLRAGLLKLGVGVLGQLLAADPGYRGPRTDCGNGHEAVFASYRDKVIDTVLGPVTVTRAWYHCAACRHGLAPRDAELGAAGTAMSPGLAAMTDRAAAAAPFTRAAALLEDLAGIRLTVKRADGPPGARGRPSGIIGVFFDGVAAKAPEATSARPARGKPVFPPGRAASGLLASSLVDGLAKAGDFREAGANHRLRGTPSLPRALIDKKFFYVKTDFAMRDVVYLDQIEQAEALLKPQRIEVLRQLAEPRSCTEVAVELEQTPQRVYYHVKRLQEARLVRQVAERQVRGIHEGIYQAAGRSYWLSPDLVGRIGLRQTRDRLSLGYLVDLMEGVQADIAALDLTRPDLPSIGVSGDIRVRPEQRKAFLDELQQTLQDLFTRYGGAEGDAFRLAVACYPQGDPDDRA
jgi:DNA-binding transcriptional ArsR family regulator